MLIETKLDVTGGGRIRAGHRTNRTGQASMDYILIVCVIRPLALFLFGIVPRMIQLVYEMAVVFLVSPLS